VHTRPASADLVVNEPVVVSLECFVVLAKLIVAIPHGEKVGRDRVDLVT